MADIVYDSPSYAGKLARPMLEDLLLDARTIANGWVTVLDEVKNKTILQDIDTDAIIQARADLFNASGNTSIGERSMTPVNMMSQDQVGVGTLLTSWQVEQQRPGANNNDITPEIGSFLVRRKGQKLAISNEKRIWLGDTALTTDNDLKWHDGFLKLAKADSNVRKFKASNGEATPTGITVGTTTVLPLVSTNSLQVGDIITCVGFTGANAAQINGKSGEVLAVDGTTIEVAIATSGTITIGANTRVQFINKWNVIEVLTQYYKRIPQHIRDSPDFRIYIPTHVADAYEDASLAAAAGQGNAYQNGSQLVFKRKQLLDLPYFAPNTIFGSRIGNLFFGTDLTSDLNEVEAKYMKPITLDDVYRYSAKFNGCVQYAFGSQIFMYLPQ